MYFYKIIDEFPRLICAKKTAAPIIIKRHHGMGLFSFINLKKRKRITLLVVDLDKIIKGDGKQKTRAIPYKCVDSLQPIFCVGNSLFFLAIHKVCQRKLPFSGAKSLAECSPPIYAVLP